MNNRSEHVLNVSIIIIDTFSTCSIIEQHNIIWTYPSVVDFLIVSVTLCMFKDDLAASTNLKYENETTLQECNESRSKWWIQDFLFTVCRLQGMLIQSRRKRTSQRL